MISPIPFSLFQINPLSLQRVAKDIGTKNIGIMENPFKFGTVVDSPYFTERIDISFQPTVQTDLLIEDALGLVEKVSDADSDI